MLELLSDACLICNYIEKYYVDKKLNIIIKLNEAKNKIPLHTAKLDAVENGNSAEGLGNATSHCLHKV